MAMIEDNYMINIVKNGRHFGTVELGWQYRDEAVRRKEILEEKLTKEDGFELTLMHVECVGREVEC